MEDGREGAGSSDAGAAKMQFSYLEVGSVKSHVASWGRWVEQDYPDEVIICIPGNPGLPGFYYPYLEHLHNISKLPVWIIGHAGHEEPVTNNNRQLAKVGGLAGRERLFGLRGQLEHKIDFIKKFTKPTTRIHLVGHSIGGWIALEILKNDVVTHRIVSANLLFPTIHHLAETPNGFWVNNIMRRCNLLIWLLIWMFEKSPWWLKNIIVRLNLYFSGAPALDIFVATIKKYFCTSVIEKVLYMTYDELDHVHNPDMSTLLRNKNRIRIVHGIRDRWAPAKLFVEIQKLIPEMIMRKVPFEHAFSLNSYEQMAELTADLLPK